MLEWISGRKEGRVMLKHYLAFTNPRTGKRESLWFGTNRRRREYRNDLQQDFGSIAIEEWEELIPRPELAQTSTVNSGSPDGTPISSKGK